MDRFGSVARLFRLDCWIWTVVGWACGDDGVVGSWNWNLIGRNFEIVVDIDHYGHIDSQGDVVVGSLDRICVDDEAVVMGNLNQIGIFYVVDVDCVVGIGCCGNWDRNIDLENYGGGIVDSLNPIEIDEGIVVCSWGRIVDSVDIDY